MSDAIPPGDEENGGRSRFVGLHARTYEMELLISGAVVFALLQLPSRIGAAFARYEAGLAGNFRVVATLVEGYLTLSLYVLIGAFVLHLVLRAYWIGLLGLESVFEGGIRWEKLKLGPLSTRALRTRIGSLARAVDRADDLCSLIFSVGFLVVITFAYTIVFLAVFVLVALTVSRLVFGGAHLTGVLQALLGVCALLLIMPGFLDKRLGSKLTPGSRSSRVLGAMIRAVHAVSPVRWTGPIQFTLGTNLSEARVAWIIAGVCLAVGVVRIGMVVADRGVLRLDSQAYFPLTLREEGIEPLHYRDRRQSGVIEPTTPSIQSVVLADPYVELVVPYLARRYNPLMESACPGLERLRGDGLTLRIRGTNAPEAVRAAAACLGSLVEVRLDGQPPGDLHWDFTIEEGSELAAVVAFLPVRELSPGRHELEVLMPGRRATPDHPDPVRHVIPFWR